jgi:hypothetical protein
MQMVRVVAIMMAGLFGLVMSAEAEENSPQATPAKVAFIVTDPLSGSAVSFQCKYCGLRSYGGTEWQVKTHGTDLNCGAICTIPRELMAITWTRFGLNALTTSRN